MIPLVDTIPRNAEKMGADKVLWHEILPTKYHIYAFNIFYPMHIFNMLSFMRKNNIPLLKESRAERILVGGQGVSNLNGCLDDIVDEIYKGEYDGDSIANGWHRKTDIDTPAVFKNTFSAVELTRGCKYRCKFCEYGWVHGGKFRQKNIDSVKSDIDRLIFTTKSKRVNFMSANLGSYYALEELLDYTDAVGIHVTNTDVCLRDFEKAKRHLTKRQTIKVGVESFDEKTRAFVNKAYSDNQLLDFVDWSVQHTGNIHFYLIYGLPNDDYDRWFEWLKILGDIRKSQQDRLIRMEFNLTNFEPCLGTPLADAPEVDFREKDYFLKHWSDALRENNFRKGGGEVTYINSRGRFGRMENSYKLLMRLKKSDSLITSAILSSFKNGIGRTIPDNVAYKFVEMCEESNGRN
jgi:radical SAM superfamily enzyme YgiQ (UPF0313 family)